MQAGNEFHTTHVNNPNQKELSIVSFENWNMHGLTKNVRSQHGQKHTWPL